MNRFEKYLTHGCRSCHTSFKENDDVTKQGLAYTPADMARLTAQGIPVSNKEIESKFYDGDDGSDFFVSSDRVKGNDINDLWEEEKLIRAKAKSAYKASKQSKKVD